LSIAVFATGRNAEEAIVRSEDALRHYREVNDPFGIGWASYMLGSLNLTAGRLDKVDQYLDEAIQIFSRAGDRSATMLLLALSAVLAHRRGQTERFLMLGGAGERLREETGAGLADTPLEGLDYALPERPTDPDQLRVWQRGRQLTDEEAISYLREDPGSTT
jgi:tetratricopeptide (TPR) repeat protein